MTMSDTITERVRRGAMLLDMKVVGWAKQIDEEDLDLAGCPTCILGQLFGTYLTGIGALGLNGADGLWTEDFGFFVTSRLRRPEAERDAEYELLRAAWLVEIRARLVPDDMAFAVATQNTPVEVP